jgi:hypothetical protein
MKRILFLSLVALSACNTVGVTTQPTPNSSTSVLGLLSVKIDLRDESNPTGSSVFNAVANRSKTQDRTIGGINDSNITIRLRQVEFLDDNYKTPFGSPTRYVQATYEIANKSTTAFSNMNFIGTSFPSDGSNPSTGTSWKGTKLGTMFDGMTTGSNLAIAEADTFPGGLNIYRNVKPTHGMRPALRGVAINPDLADMQVYTRTGNPATGEIDKLTADVLPFYPTAQLLDFGYVARNFTGGRTISVTPAACAIATDTSCYTGQVTLGFVLPRQPVPLNTPATFSFQFVVAQESATIATQSLEEQSDAKGSGRIQALFSTLPNLSPMVNLLTGSGFYGASTLNKRTLCDVRTAQASPTTTPSFASPELLTSKAGVKMEDVVPAPNTMNASGSSAVNATYCQAMNSPSESSLVIQGFQTGQRRASVTEHYNGAFNPAGYIPTTPFKPGEEVEVSLSSNLTRAGDNAAINPVVYRFRIATTAQSAAGFTSAASPATATLPLSVVTGDFNKDGNLDLAASNQTSNTVSIFTGTGIGAFGAATSFAVGSAPTALIAGDFNNDGSLDLATANTTASTISILINNNLGGFSAAVNYPVNSNPKSITTGDFNGDGKLDLATTSDNVNGTLSVLLGTGVTGTFSAVSSYVAGAAAQQNGVIAGDFNADGHLDLAVALFSLEPADPLSPGAVSILLGNGSGRFLNPVFHTVASSPNSLATGDFNNDGRLDLATTNNDTSAPVSVLLSNKSGGYSTPLELQNNSIPTSITTGDTNGDTRLDIITSSDADTITYYQNSGLGTFLAGVDTALPANSAPASITAGDLNNDGRLDVVIANSGLNNLGVLLKQ